jgi:hypothetical protein
MMENVRALSYEFSVRFMRQRALSTIARYIAEYISEIPPGDLKNLAAGEADMVNILEGELQKRIPEGDLGALVQKVLPFVSCLGENDLDTIFDRTVQNLEPEHSSVLLNHNGWFRRQFSEAWKRFLKVIEEYSGKASE